MKHGKHEITRSVALLDYEIDRSGDGRTVIAYAAAFGNEYEVSDRHGHYDEKINTAAFNKVLARSGAIGNVQVHFNHGLTLWGTPSDRYAMPVGTPLEIKPDGIGLLTRTRYAGTDLGDEVLQLWRDDAIRGQSFRGAIYQSRTVTAKGPNGRPIIERLQLGLREYGPTPNPANIAAGLVAIRSDLSQRFPEATEDEIAALEQLYLNTPTLDDLHEIPGDDPADDSVPVDPPDPGLSDVLKLVNANRRRRT
jgi:phage head maturation protease